MVAKKDKTLPIGASNSKVKKGHRITKARYGSVSKLKIMRDVTKYKQAQNEIEHLAKFPSENPFPVLRISQDGTILYSNGPGPRLLDKWKRYVGDSAPGQWCKLIREVLRSGQIKVKETNLDDRIISFVLAPVKDAGYVNVYGRDITKLKKAEQELRKAMDELETRVSKRTADLAKTVDVLQQEVKQRERAEETAKAERQRFNDVLETLPVYVCLLTPDHYMPFANRVFRELFVYYPDKKCYEFLFRRSEPCEICETYSVLKTGKPHQWEWTGPNGRNYDIFDFPFKGTNGSDLILEMGIDITEQKRAQEQLRSASLYSRGLLEASIDPLVTVSPEGKITDVNKATETATGLSRESLIGTDFSDYFTEPAKARQGYKKVLSEVQVKDYQLTIRHITGHTTDVLYNATVYKNKAGQVQGVFAAARDVTERKRAESALKESEEKYRSLVEVSPEAICVAIDEKVAFANTSALKLLRAKNAEELTGRSIWDFIHPESIEVVKNDIKELLEKKGKVPPRETKLIRLDGSTVKVEASTTTVAHQDKVGVLAIFHDITERKKAEARRGVTNSLLQLFAQITSRKEYLDSVVETIRDWSGCRCVGIRLANADGYIPYESYVGFSEEFLSVESNLSLNEDVCACIRVVTQAPETQDAGVTNERGSFRCDNTFNFVNSLSENQKKRFRGNCLKMGFASIAVIPIRYRQNILGAIHLADEGENRAPLETVEFLEDMAVLIGEAVYRFNVEESLRSNEERLLEAQRLAHLGNWDWDIISDKLWWSDEVYRIFGVKPQQFDATYEAFLSYVHPDDRKLVEKSVNKALYEGKTYSIDHRVIRPDGSERIVHEKAEVTYDASQKPLRMIGTVHDVTEQQKAEEEIRHNQQQLRSLTAQLQLTEERERRRIASDLHDSVGQILAFARREIVTLQKAAPEELATSLKEIGNQLNQAVEQTRTLSFDLSPSVLYDLGFEVAVEELIEKFAKERKIQCHFENSKDQKPLADSVKILLYRAIRELLINIAKHAKAKSVKISLARANNDIHVTVEDNGKGFDLSILDNRQGRPKGFGIFNIRERLAHIGGRFKIQSARGKGTKVTLVAPLQTDANQD